MLLLSNDNVKHIEHAERQLQHEQAVALDGFADPDTLSDSMLASPTIEVSLGAFNDGRGLSLARYLRLNKNYTGVLRATGNLLPDQLQAIYQLGFDEVLVGDVNLARHSETDWLDAHRRLNDLTACLPAYVEKDDGQPSVWSKRMATAQ